MVICVGWEVKTEADLAVAARERSNLQNISFDCAKAKNFLDGLISHPVTISTDAAGAAFGLAIDDALGVLKGETNEDTLEGYVGLLEGAGYDTGYDFFA